MDDYDPEPCPHEGWPLDAIPDEHVEDCESCRRAFARQRRWRAAK